MIPFKNLSIAYIYFDETSFYVAEFYETKDIKKFPVNNQLGTEVSIPETLQVLSFEANHAPVLLSDEMPALTNTFAEALRETLEQKVHLSHAQPLDTQKVSQIRLCVCLRLLKI